MTSKLIRHGLLMAVALLGPNLAVHAADTPIDIQWEDLMPAGAPSADDVDALLGIHDPGDAPPADLTQVDDPQVVTAYNDKIIRMPGYLVPLDFQSEGSKQFLLVPYVGACIHVPPPPPNQIVLVTTEEPYRSEGLFEPVYVTGRFTVASTSTELADVAYALSAEDIEAFIYE